MIKTNLKISFLSLVILFLLDGFPRGLPAAANSHSSLPGKERRTGQTCPQWEWRSHPLLCFWEGSATFLNYIQISTIFPAWFLMFSMNHKHWPGALHSKTTLDCVLCLTWGPEAHPQFWNDPKALSLKWCKADAQQESVKGFMDKGRVFLLG